MNVKAAIAIKVLATVAILGIMLYALYVSKDHITEVATWFGIPGWQATTAFILVDLPAVLGKVFQLPIFKPETHRHGRQMTKVSGSISLACNVTAGLILGSFGAAAWGVFVVVMFLYLEGKLGKMQFASAVKAAKTKAAKTRKAAKAPATAAPSAPAATIAPMRITGTGRAKCLPGCGCKRHTANRVTAP